jgi:hypothetical protein
MPKKQPSEIENQRIRELEIEFRKAQIEIDCLKELRRLCEVKPTEKKSK